MTLPRSAACLVLALGACGRERPDPRLAEVLTPVHVTVRVIDVAVEKHCEGTFTEQLTCLVTRAQRDGCVYVEAGAAADTPERSARPDPARCDVTRYSTERRLLRGEPVKKASLFVEPAGERVVVDLVDSIHAVYLLEGALVIQKVLFSSATRPAGFTRPDGTLDWSQVPPLLAVLDEHQVTQLTATRLDALLAKTPGGRHALAESLLALAPLVSTEEEGWDLALSRLDEADRARVREAMLTAVAEGNEATLHWFLKHEEAQGPALLDALEGAMASDTYTTSALLPTLLELDPKRAEKVACDQLEQRWHEAALNGPAEYEGSMPPDATVLAVIVARKTKCPWVLPLLERDPCSWELHCDPDLDDGKLTPLCTAEQATKVLERTLHPNPDPDAEVEDDGISDWGALLVAAARIQGPLPPAFTLANERRLYPLTSTFSGAEDDVDPCAELASAPADWACRLPPALTTAKNAGCRLVLDDAKKTATLSPVDPDGGVPFAPRPYSLHHD